MKNSREKAWSSTDKILVDERVLKELGNTQKYPAKICRQLTLKIFALQGNPRPSDYKANSDSTHRMSPMSITLYGSGQPL
jgi:hypothetical protein